MRIDTQSGIHGKLIAFAEVNPSRVIPGDGVNHTDGVAIVRRDDAYLTSDTRTYSVHSLGESVRGDLMAYNGAYDLTLGEAQREFQRRTGYVANVASER